MAPGWQTLAGLGTTKVFEQLSDGSLRRSTGSFARVARG